MQGRIVAGGKYLVTAAACCAFLVRPANAASCGNFNSIAQSEIASQVVALRRLEHEASDRLKGLDSRPFAYLRDEARKVAAILGEPAALAREDELKFCRSWTQPTRKTCAEAAQTLLEILSKHVADPKANYDKPRYAAAIGECEKLIDLKPMPSAIRGTD